MAKLTKAQRARLEAIPDGLPGARPHTPADARVFKALYDRHLITVVRSIGVLNPVWFYARTDRGRAALSTPGGRIMATLIPCPHCGSSDVRAGTHKDDFENTRFEVSCSQCPASMGFLVDAQPWGDDIDKLKAETIAAWNRRTSPDAINALVAALKPFATFSDFATERTEDGWVWSDSYYRERISTWFGPSDFGIARSALSAFEQEGRS